MSCQGQKEKRVQCVINVSLLIVKKHSYKIIGGVALVCTEVS